MNANHGEIAEYLNGSCRSIDQAASAFKVSDDEVREALEESEIDCCEACGYWMERDELTEDENGDLHCGECS